nr:hypothetical protein 1 [Paracoccaceae bacterium]
MSNPFFIPAIADAQIQKPESGSKEAERIFPKYVRLTLEKLERSISDAQGRYELGQAYANPKPSLNWRVVKQADELLDEEVVIALKVGISKMVIGADGEKELKVPASGLLGHLAKWKELIEFIGANPDSEAGKAFHAVAIAQAKPKSQPKAEGKSGWEYDAESDSYLAV